MKPVNARKEGQIYKNFRKWVEETYPKSEPSDYEWEEIIAEDEDPLPESPST